MVTFNFGDLGLPDTRQRFKPQAGDIVFFIPRKPNAIQALFQGSQSKLFGSRLADVSHAAIVSEIGTNGDARLRHIDEQGPGHFASKWLNEEITICESDMSQYQNDFDFLVIHPDNDRDRQAITSQLALYFKQRQQYYWSAAACMTAALVQYQASFGETHRRTRQFGENSGRECCSTLVAACLRSSLDHSITTIDHTPQSLARTLLEGTANNQHSFSAYRGSYEHNEIRGTAVTVNQRSEQATRSPRARAFLTLASDANDERARPAAVSLTQTVNRAEKPSILLKILSSSIGKKFILPILCLFLRPSFSARESKSTTRRTGQLTAERIVLTGTGMARL